MSETPKRRWHQFGLGTMFVATALVASVLAMGRQNTALAGIALLLLSAAAIEGPISRSRPPAP